jgi:hypothetical protein
MKRPEFIVSSGNKKIEIWDNCLQISVTQHIKFNLRISTSLNEQGWGFPTVAGEVS